MHTDDQAPCSITSESVGAAVVVHVAGEVDQVTADDLSDRLGEVVRPSAPVVLDLTGLHFLGACGIRVLLEQHERCVRDGGSFAVVATSAVVLRPLRVLELEDVLNVRPSVPEALRRQEVPLA
ncbi:STAS domain-containing protein [Lentzea sp. NPDC042327]|uniref:STAS domain-containing protein n=1 Tax=Lentzea sp. NPDC042327 TaxID=3154801 RepID=UPI0033F3282A